MTTITNIIDKIQNIKEIIVATEKAHIKIMLDMEENYKKLFTDTTTLAAIPDIKNNSSEIDRLYRNFFTSVKLIIEKE